MVLGPAGESMNLRKTDFVTADCAVADIFIYKRDGFKERENIKIFLAV